MDAEKTWLVSSTGHGIKLRIKSLAFLIIPIVNTLGDSYGITIVSEDFEYWLDATFIAIAGVLHVWGWIRALPYWR